MLSFKRGAREPIGGDDSVNSLLKYTIWDWEYSVASWLAHPGVHPSILLPNREPHNTFIDVLSLNGVKNMLLPWLIAQRLRGAGGRETAGEN